MALRFNQPRRSFSPRGGGGGVTYRLLSLGAGLALIVMLVQITQSTVTREKFALVLGDAKPVVEFEDTDEPPVPLDTVDRELLQQVEDNTPFTAEETEPWFHLIEVARDTSDARMAEASLGPIVYTQLISQPEFYRGQVIEIAGNVRRVEKLVPAENDLDLSAYYRVIIQPERDVLRPFTLYCLNLPEGWSTGNDFPNDGLMMVDAFFFKNWPHAAQGDVSLSPIFVSRTVRPVQFIQPPTEEQPSWPMWQVAALALVIAVAVVVWISRSQYESKTTRYPAEATEIGRQLNDLELSDMPGNQERPQ